MKTCRAKKNIDQNLTQLGGKTELPASPEEAALERVPNAQHGTN
jgi:7-cyano-7-deazaguanine reductase